jgi:hypothetical protein
MNDTEPELVDIGYGSNWNIEDFKCFVKNNKEALFI